jgi:hypothetical protein
MIWVTLQLVMPMIASKWRNLLVRELPLLCVAVAESKFGAGPVLVKVGRMKEQNEAE